MLSTSLKKNSTAVLLLFAALGFAFILIELVNLGHTGGPRMISIVACILGIVLSLAALALAALESQQADSREQVDLFAAPPTAEASGPSPAEAALCQEVAAGIEAAARRFLGCGSGSWNWRQSGSGSALQGSICC